jgi:hypothetical protein
MRQHRYGRPAAPPRRTDPLTGFFVLRTDGAGDAGPVLARIAGELYALVFTNAARANGARATLGVVARPFYICDANRAELVRELKASGARGFIVDYDPSSATYTSAGEIPHAA